MAKKANWHTDIVVDGEGFGLALMKKASGCYSLQVSPDTPSPKARRALKKLHDALRGLPEACGEAASKRKVTRAVKQVGARWNQWHKESR